MASTAPFTPAQIASVNTGTPAPTTSNVDLNAPAPLPSVPSSTTNAPNYGSQVANNIGNTFTQGAKNITSDISNVPNVAKQSGGGPVADVASTLAGAGHVAGDIAGTAGGIIGSFISPLLSDSVKSKIGDVTSAISDKVNAIQGMTPQIAKSLGDVFNTSTLLGGEAAEPVVKSGVEAGANAVGDMIPDVKPSVPKLDTPLPEQQGVTEAQSQVSTAQQAREAAAPQAVEGVKSINKLVSGNKATLGQQFESDAVNLDKADPNTKLNLTTDQLKSLQDLKTGKNFSLPKSISDEHALNNGDLPSLSSYTDKPVSLSRTQSQDLIRELNRSTFKENADGSIAKDYSRLGITNDIKNSASSAFGKPWDDIYSKYSAGRSAIDKIDSLVNLDPKATPEDINKQLQGIIKQSATPEGRLILRQAVNEYKATNGIDLTDPVKAVQQISDKQDALDAANDNLTQSQRELAKAQRASAIAKVKGGYLKQMGTAAKNPATISRLVERGVIGGAVIYPLLSVLRRAMSGK